MRRAIILLIIVLIGIFTIACSEVKNKKGPDPVVYSAQKQNTEVDVFDFEAAYSICKDLLKNYYEAALCGRQLDTTPFITNKNLNQYIKLKCKDGKTIVTEETLTISYGLDDIKWNFDDEYGYLKVVAEVGQDGGSFSESNQFLVCNHQGNLVIVDWYSEGVGTPGSLDESIRKDIKNINNPKIWDNQKFADEILKLANAVVKQQ